MEKKLVFATPKLLKIRNSLKVAIETRYIGPSNFKGSRIAVQAGDRPRMYVCKRMDLNDDEAHAAAARLYCEKYGWAGKLVQGGTSSGNVFVFVD